MTKTGAHKLKRATFMYSCHGVFTDQFIFRMILRESRISFKSHKPVSRTSENGVFHILITLGLVFLFHILHFECAHRRKEASIFAGKSALKLIYIKINRRVKTL